MKIVTLNLWNGGRLLNNARAFLKEQNADIYFLQEAYDGHGDIASRLRTVEILSRDFPEHDVFFAPAYLDMRQNEGPIEDGQLILSKYTMRERESVFVDIPYGAYDQDATTDFSKFPAGFAKCEIDVFDKRITLINVHGPVNLNGDEPDERRSRFVDLILEKIGSDSAIVAGDFNLRPSNQALNPLNDSMQNVFGGELKTTFNLGRKDLDKFPGYGQSAVDMIYVTSDMKFESKTCFEVDVSDHLPLVCELSW